jgi:hypothetical protein
VKKIITSENRQQNESAVSERKRKRRRGQANIFGIWRHKAENLEEKAWRRRGSIGGSDQYLGGVAAAK